MSGIDRWIDACEAAEKNRDYKEMLRAANEIVRLAPAQPQPYYARGLALQHLERFEEAVTTYLHAVTHDAAYVMAWINLGFCCQELNALDEAEQACRRVIELSGQKDNPVSAPYWNLAILELLKGDLRNGFAHYPARYAALDRKKPPYPQPVWQGEDVHDKVIFVTVDQGHGDTLLMARYLPLLQGKGAHVLVQAQPALVPYMKHMKGVDAVFTVDAAPPAFDFQVSEFDLPRLFDSDLGTLPATNYLPILSPDTKTFLPATDKKKIGLVWAGFAGHANDKNRSLPLSALEPLLTLPDFAFYALNRDKRVGDNEILVRHRITDLSGRIDNFADAARFIAQMDLIISCDTSVAHLAGGMGKPLWVMLPFAPSWVWMMGREDSPWYPTARLFRQSKRGDWIEVVRGLSAALKNL